MLEGSVSEFLQGFAQTPACSPAGKSHTLIKMNKSTKIETGGTP